MTQLTDLLDLPERIQKSQFVVTLEKGVGDPDPRPASEGDA